LNSKQFVDKLTKIQTVKRVISENLKMKEKGEINLKKEIRDIDKISKVHDK